MQKTLASSHPDALDLPFAFYDSGDFSACLVELEPYVGEGIPADIRIPALLRQASCYSELERYADSLNSLLSLAPVIDDGTDHQRAHFYGQRAYLYRRLENVSAAMLDYEAARFWAQESGSKLAEASVRNNLAKIYSELDRSDEAIAESDAAISIASQLSDEMHLGRFYDQRAQILIDQKSYAEAIRFSEKALRLLNGHPSEAEARTTHGRALIGLGTVYLQSEDPFASLRARRDAAKLIQVTPDTELIRLALAKSDGHVSRAAQMLGMRHYALTNIVKSRKIERRPIRKRRKTLITK
jgi:tetratricopeptide (TPR) repeat protein